jgi:hypothetical protein
MLEDALTGLRRLASDPSFLLERLMFTRSLQTPPLVGATSKELSACRDR